MPVCPTCGTPLAPDAPAGLCPVCLAKAASASARPDETEVVARVRAALAQQGDLELGAVIGRGGMGFVFRGRQRRLDREVAVKVLDPELSRNPAFAERFAREARALAKLSHPHIVAVHDYGQAGELYYLVLEYVDGVNLRQALQTKSIAPAQALAIVPQICDALEFAHGLGIVHRDVKPENILLDRRGRVKITDFGLAKLLGVEVPIGSLTSTGQVLGTLRYMAPEQMERPLEVDHRADIYSLGVVFYEMLTGEIPMGRFAPPSKKVQVDVALDEVVLRTLEREPERRYQHAVEVKTDVESIGAGGRPAAPVAVAPAPPASETRPRLSWLAVNSAVFALGVPFFAALLFVPAVILVRAPAAPHADGSMFVLVFGVFLTLCLGLSSAAGWSALSRIEREWPRWYGVGAATIGLWVLPLLIVAIVLSFFVFAAGEILHVNRGWPIVWLAWTFMVLTGSVLWIVHRRRCFLARVAGPIAERR